MDQNQNKPVPVGQVPEGGLSLGCFFFSLILYLLYDMPVGKMERKKN